MQYKQKAYSLSTVFQRSVLERGILYNEQLIEIAMSWAWADKFSDLYKVA